MGLILGADIPAFRFRAKYRLEPGSCLKDVAAFFDCALPFEVTFWRVNRDPQGRLCDRVSHRCPLFCRGTGITPNMVCIDALHTVYLGVYKTYCMAVCWALIDANVFGFTGPFDRVFEMTARRLTSDLLGFWELQGPSKKSRLTRLTAKMLGSRNQHDFKSKAAEAGECVAWAVDLMQRHHTTVQYGRPLLSAGKALLEWKELIASAGDVVTHAEYSKSLELAVRHNSAMQAAQLELPPKNHLWIHLCLRLLVCGHPRRYACWLDESLNSCFSAVCQASHRLTWESSIFERIRLIHTSLEILFFQAGMTICSDQSKKCIWA